MLVLHPSRNEAPAMQLCQLWGVAQLGSRRRSRARQRARVSWDLYYASRLLISCVWSAGVTVSSIAVLRHTSPIV